MSSAAWAAVLFLVASVAALLLVIHVMPEAAGIPVVVIAPLLGIGSVSGQLADEGFHQEKADEALEQGRRAQVGDDRAT